MNRIRNSSTHSNPLPLTGASDPTHRLGAPGDPADAAGGVRWDLIRRLRREIANGTYASEARWNEAVSRLALDLGH